MLNVVKKFTDHRKPHQVSVVRSIGDIDPHIAAYHDPGSVISEQYRAVFARLQPAAHPYHYFVITSTSYHEGRSTALLNLAVTIVRETGKKVLVIDCDFQYPSLHQLLNLPLEGGILDILSGKAELQTVIKETVLPNLSLLSAGSVPDNMFGIFGARKLKSTIEILKQRYDFLLFDTSPIGFHTDAGLLSEFVDGIVMVIRCEATQRESIDMAKRKLENLQTKVLGCILTDYKYHIPPLIYKLL